MKSSGGPAKRVLMQRGGPHPVRGFVRRTSRSSPARPTGLVIGTLTAVSAAVFLLAGGGAVVWLAVPAALAAAAGCRTTRGALLGAAAVVGGTTLPCALWTAAGMPSPLLVAIVAAASVAVLIGVRAPLERERDALRDSALSDPLTGIANRRALLGRADYEIARHTRARHTFAVVMLDLDGFKSLNDRFGHAAGDDLLRDVASSLTRAMRAQDTVARLGGDEFCVLAPETDDGGTAQLAHRVKQAVGDVSAGVDSVGASVGVAVFPQDGRTAAELMHAADQRLLDVKRERHRRRPQRRAA
jgi:diguanylate cyclase (GGDEF)-like protein